MQRLRRGHLRLPWDQATRGGVARVQAERNAIVLPMVPVAKDRARIAVCQSNLRQISLAARMYVEDRGGMSADLG